MIILRTSESSHHILTWDGQVLEHFGGESSRRVHVGVLTSIVVNADRHNTHELTFKTVVGSVLSILIDEKALAKANELVAEVQKAIASSNI
jgi:hypothetical protein